MSHRRFHIYGPDNADRRLVFVPALGVQARFYIPFAEALAKHNWCVEVMELRGYAPDEPSPSRKNNYNYQTVITDDLIPALQTRTADLTVVGGHSLGGQMALCALASHPNLANGLLHIGCSSPHHRYFPFKTQLLLQLMRIIVPTSSQLLGYFPGKQLGFAGQEAPGLMHDWLHLAMTDRFVDMPRLPDLPNQLAGFDKPLLSIGFDDDDLAPTKAIDGMLSRVPNATLSQHVLDETELGTKANHFKWAKSPDAVTARILDWAANDLG